MAPQAVLPALEWVSHRLAPFVSGLLMAVGTGCFLVSTVESVALRPAEMLGYGGATLRIVTIPGSLNGPTEAESSLRLSADLIAFAGTQDASFAFARGNGTGLVTVLDEQGRFRSGGSRLAADLAPAGSGASVVVSDAVDPETAVQSPAVPEGATVAGTFSADVEFDGRYPTHVYNVDAVPFGTGNYVVATGDPDQVDPAFVDALIEVFESNGMQLVHVSEGSAASISTVFRDAARSPYGVVILLFATVVAVALLLVLLLHARGSRMRLVVEATIGTARPALRRLVTRRLLSPAVAGIALGAVVVTIAVLSTQPVALAEPAARLSAVIVAVGMSLVAATSMAWFVGVREARKVADAVPC